MVHNTPAKQLTERDRAVLLWIGGAGIATFNQLRRRYWAGKSDGVVRARLRQLVKADYLHSFTVDVREPGERVFVLTPGGRTRVGPELKDGLLAGLPPPPEIAQQLLAQDAYIFLEEQIRGAGGKLTAWQSERHLRAARLRDRYRESGKRERLAATSRSAIPDARAEVIWASGEQQTLHIEVDGAYYGEMLRKKAKSLCETGHSILWVCTSARSSYLRRVLANYPSIEVLPVWPPSNE